MPPASGEVKLETKPSADPGQTPGTAASPTGCPLCGSARLSVSIAHVSDYEYGVPGEWSIARCGNCRLIFQTPLPDPDEIPSFYPDTYSAFVPDPATSLLFRGAFWLDARRVRRLIGSEGRVLDVGCGDGSVLAAMRRHGRWDLWGVELGPGAARRAQARGLNVLVGDIAHSELPVGSFDLIRMGHVIEHVLDPMETLRQAFDLLAPGGTLFGETPNTACLDLKLFGRYWGALHVPRHIVFFDHENLRQALELAGFKDVRIIPRLRTVGWSAGVQNLLRDKFGLRIPANGRVRWYLLLILPFLPVTLLQSWLDWPSTVAFVARKPLQAGGLDAHAA